MDRGVRSGQSAAFSDPGVRTQLENLNLRPLWEEYRDLAPPQPVATEESLHWPWRSVGPMLEKAAAEVPAEIAERRVLQLVNPGNGGRPGTTNTIAAAMQVVRSGEYSPPHRHTAAALRFVIRGSLECTTSVNGEAYEMLPGDLILTPKWTWHAHSNGSADDAIWLDALDVPLTLQLNCMFFEAREEDDIDLETEVVPHACFGDFGDEQRARTLENIASPCLRYSRSAVVSALKSRPYDEAGARYVRYLNPVTGRSVLPTLECQMLDLRSGGRTGNRRSTESVVFIVVEGAGISQIGEQTIEWRQHDVFTGPRWQWTRHNAESGRALIFSISDREVLSSIDLLYVQEKGDS
jgi:gentisate 1,2-dioxygenase